MEAPPSPPPPRDQTLSLRDGRVLGYTQTGDPLGKPLFSAVQLGLTLVQRMPWWLLCLLLEPSVSLIRLDPVAAKKVLPASFPPADQAIFAWPDLQVLDRAFPIVKRKDEKQYGEYRTKRVFLEIYDEMQWAMESGQVYRTRLEPGPADLAVAHEGR